MSGFKNSEISIYSGKINRKTVELSKYYGKVQYPNVRSHFLIMVKCVKKNNLHMKNCRAA